MADQINTSGGSSVQGDVEAGRDFVGRDQNIINNIVVVGRFLELAQIEGLFPSLGTRESFADVNAAVEETFKLRLGEDLTEATAFAGAVLRDYVAEWASLDPRKPVRLFDFVDGLTTVVGSELYLAGYFDTIWKVIKDSPDRVLPLEATSRLYQKHYNRSLTLSIRGYSIARSLDDHSPLEPPFDRYDSDKKVRFTQSEDSTTLFVHFYYLIRQDLTEEWVIQTRDWSPKLLRLISAGIVLDLIRVVSDNSITVQFLNELADLFDPKPE